MNNIEELWQAEVNGQIYETNFEELIQWIAEGALLPQDKVRRGNLRWIEAQKVPTLYGHFNAITLGINPPVVQSTMAQTPVAPSSQGFVNQRTPPPFEHQAENSCVLHSDQQAKFHCETCINYFCYDCPKTSGGLANCCPLCGAICRSLDAMQESANEENFYSEGEEFVNQGGQEEEHLSNQSQQKQSSQNAGRSSVYTAPPPKNGVGGVILGLFFALILSAGGAYLWAYQFSTVDEAAEKKITEVVVLEEKYNTDRQGLRLQFASAATNAAGETLEKAQARLQSKFDSDRATIVSNYRDNQAFSRFYTTALIAFAVLFFAIIGFKISSR